MDKNSGSDDNHSGTAELQIWQLADCRFAYTLNNSQPVRCTWISDQPLFYSDFEDVTDEDMLFDDPVLQALERDIAQLREKTEAYEKIAKDFVVPENNTSRLFLEDASFATERVCSAPPSLDSLLEVLQQSRLASQFLSFAALQGVKLSPSRQVMDASYDRAGQVIWIRTDLDLPLQILLAARELRRMWQHKNGAGLHPLAFHPDFAVLINRAQTADQVAAMVRVAWELQLSGEKSAWMRLENSPLSDLSRAFAREAISDFRSIHSGSAARATLESWFLSERCRKADRQLIQQMLADYQGYAFSDNVEASRMIALDLLKALGKMPFGQNYLTPVVNQIISDPVFTDVRDRANANFLWFIKFERSFTEAEKEIKPSLPAKDSRPSALVIPLPSRDGGDPSSSRANGTTGAGGDVVFLSLPRGD
ncbi:MAG: hypothetical protein KBC88_05115 [Alphaproteobacteria bacterium]|jgi:hypothetical protein|nr:hypothetical protein [Alphaproteobacteria bacterium]MBP9868291.1 hypothetical protein [Alphaproteobacteria bacterium]